MNIILYLTLMCISIIFFYYIYLKKTKPYIKGQIIEINVGSSSSNNSKSFMLDNRYNYYCPWIINNKNWSNKNIHFHTTLEKNKLTITRGDSTNGWNMNLKFNCRRVLKPNKEILNETFSDYNQTFEFVPKNQFKYEKDSKFINQYSNNLKLDNSEYYNLKNKLKFKKNYNFSVSENQKKIDYIKKLDKKTDYPLIKRELELIEMDHILIVLKERYKNTNNIKFKINNDYSQNLLYSYDLVKEWIIEKISLEADKELYKMDSINNTRFKYINDDLLEYSNYQKWERFKFKMVLYRDNKLTNYIIYFELVHKNPNYYINDLVILGTDIQENILFAEYKKNLFKPKYKLNVENDINYDKDEINEFVNSKYKKEIYDYSRYYCFYKENAKNKLECISPNALDDSIGIYDSPCIYNEDCPFYKKNKNYPNSRGGCFNGYCELPTNVNLLGYKEYIESNNPICYNCKKTDNCNGIECNMCCDDQKNTKLYPNLNGPDYAYPNDFNERIKHSNYFSDKNMAPIKLIA